MSEEKILHIYGQDGPHGVVRIYGNTSGLKELKDSIDKALLDGNNTSDTVFVSDGEGYRIFVDKQEDEKFFEDLHSTYPDNWSKL